MKKETEEKLNSMQWISWANKNVEKLEDLVYNIDNVGLLHVRNTLASEFLIEYTPDQLNEEYLLAKATLKRIK